MKFSLYTFLFFISGDIEAQVLDIAKIQLIHSSILRSKHLPNISSKALNVLPKRRIMQEYLFGRIDDYHTLEPLHFCSVTLSFNNTVIQKSQTDDTTSNILKMNCTIYRSPARVMRSPSLLLRLMTMD